MLQQYEEDRFSFVQGNNELLREPLLEPNQDRLRNFRDAIALRLMHQHQNCRICIDICVVEGRE